MCIAAYRRKISMFRINILLIFPYLTGQYIGNSAESAARTVARCTRYCTALTLPADLCPAASESASFKVLAMTQNSPAGLCQLLNQVNSYCITAELELCKLCPLIASLISLLCS